ncbi:RICIN domain-containing protein [Kitasatospora sp. NPDC001159]
MGPAPAARRRGSNRRLGRALPPALAVLALQLAAVTPAQATADTPLNGVTYTIGSALDGKCLGTQWAQAAGGTPVVQASCQGLLTQRWRLLQVNTTSPAHYVLINTATERCLVIGDGGRAVTQDCGTVPSNEQFTISTDPGRGSTLTVLSSRQCLAVPGDSTQDNLQVQQYSCATTPGQSWTLTRTEPLLFANPGFENGTAGWKFSAHTGVATNNPHSGTRLAYLDSGTGYRISQQVTALTAGSFDLSAWIATGAAGATMTVSVNGTPTQSLTLPDQATYAKYTLPRVKVAAGDKVTLAFGSSPNGWVNIDDIAVAPSAPNDPQISSSDPTVVAMFNWAKTKANSWVQQPGATGTVNIDENNPSGTGSATYDTTYWAGYPFRTDYYIRDFAHQLVGAHLLGLDAQNKTMLRSFARSATSVTGNYPVWSMNFDAKTYGGIDYHGPDAFVRELPAPFELVQKAAEAYQWTGDTDYANDPTLSGYIKNTLSSFIATHPGPVDNGSVPIPQATSNDIFTGIASYAESSQATYAEAGDALASQYQAYLGAATLAIARGDTASAASYDRAASALKTYFNSTWSVNPTNPADVVHAYDTNGNPIGGWGYETSVLMPMKNLLDPGPRLTSYLSAIDSADSGPQRSPNEEGYTYLPDTFFAGHDGTTAWKWMQSVYGSINQVHATNRLLNGDYPELPFTLLSQTVQGLLGVQPDAADNTVITASQLPATMGWLQVSSIPVGHGTVTLRQDGQTSSTLTNTGTANRTWEARFPGTHTGITVNGTAQPARTKTVDGVTYTYTTVTVAPDQTTTVAVTG